MKPSPSHRSLTAEEFVYQQPDDVRCELVAGEMVMEPLPGAEHGFLAGSFVYYLRSFAELHGLGRVLGETGYVLERGPDTVRGPDVSFVSHARWATLADKQKFFEGPPDLAIEIASPDDSRPQLAAKARGYLAAGALLVWVVWPKRKCVEVFRPGSSPQLLGPESALDGGEVLPGFRLPVALVFQD